MSDWLKKLRECAVEKVDEVPKGWKTARQIAEETHLSHQRVRGLIYEGVRSGKIQTRTFRVKTSTKVYPIPHYK
jgi:predicted transcriptional regulator